MLLGVPKLLVVGWCKWRLMNTFQTMCTIMKTDTFLGIVAGVNECKLV